MNEYVVLILSYILGSIPFSLIITKTKGIDLRSIGSGNIGATNVLRTGNKYLAALALLLDSLKGIIAVCMAQQILKGDDFYTYLSAILVVLGHMFPIWLKFKGGKGVATTLGALLALNTLISLVFIFTWVTVFLVFRYSSLSSLSAITTATIVAPFFHINLFLTLLTIATLIYLKHHKNIVNLFQGKENKIL